MNKREIVLELHKKLSYAARREVERTFPEYFYTYAERQSQSGLKVGDWVVVTGKLNSDDDKKGWCNGWNAYRMDEFVGKAHLITRDVQSAGFELTGSYLFPYFLLRKATYAEIHKQSPLKVGDTVKFIAKPVMGEHGFNLWVNETMEQVKGKTGKITEDRGDGFLVDIPKDDSGYNEYIYPCFIMEKAEPAIEQSGMPEPYIPAAYTNLQRADFYLLKLAEFLNKGWIYEEGDEYKTLQYNRDTEQLGFAGRRIILTGEVCFAPFVTMCDINEAMTEAWKEYVIQFFKGKL